jgi:maleylacetoacetate isomerase/maleylpyruvate isomerase
MTFRLFGFWRSLATYRVRVALALKGIPVEEVSVNLLQGKQFEDAYRAINPQSVVPALAVDDGSALFQSLAILEYLDETHPEPPLLPEDPRGRARVRGIAMIAACDGHPLVVPRIRNYLEKELRVDEAARNRWLSHWTLKALEAMEAHLAKEPETGRLCHGDTPTIADICLASQMIAATQYFNCDVSGVPTASRIFAECMKIEAFDRSQPMKQPDAPKGPLH